jgi:hypothetical protein
MWFCICVETNAGDFNELEIYRRWSKAEIHTEVLKAANWESGRRRHDTCNFKMDLTELRLENRNKFWDR